MINWGGWGAGVSKCFPEHCSNMFLRSPAFQLLFTDVFFAKIRLGSICAAYA